MQRCFVLLPFLLLWPAQAREIVVTPGPDAIARALSAAQPGDVVRLRAGTYREHITITQSVWIAGEPSAVIDPSEPVRFTWTAATNIGVGVYRAAVKERPRALCLDGKLIAEVDERRKETQAAGDWFWKTLLARGPKLSAFKFVQALWIYRSDEKAIYVHLPNDADPARAAFTAVFTTAPVVTFKGATGAALSGVTIAHGFDGVAFTAGSSRCAVSNCVVGPWDKVGIGFSGGASNCLAEHNEVFRGAYEDWAPHEGSKPRYDVWLIHKRAGLYDRVGISLVRAGRGNRVHANHIHETFDGIDVGDSSVESLDEPLTDPDAGRDTGIWENIIERTRDSGIELGAGCINVRVHHNTLRETHGGLRYKLPRIGPVFIYRNLLLDGAPFNIWYSMDDSPAEGYVYHNTIVGGGSAALMYSSFETPHHIGAPKWHYYNNLAITPKGFFRNSNVPAPVNFIADYNVVVGGNRPYPNDTTRDAHSRYVESVPLTPGFPPQPLPGSAAIDAGLDLSTAFHGKPLPGCEPAYFKGKAPDAGAIEVE